MEKEIKTIDWDGESGYSETIEGGFVLIEEQQHYNGNFLVYERDIQTEIEKLIDVLKEKSVITDADILKIKDKK